MVNSFHNHGGAMGVDISPYDSFFFYNSVVYMMKKIQDLCIVLRPAHASYCIHSKFRYKAIKYRSYTMANILSDVYIIYVYIIYYFIKIWELCGVLFFFPCVTAKTVVVMAPNCTHHCLYCID